jgi:hypothetical protein
LSKSSPLNFASEATNRARHAQSMADAAERDLEAGQTLMELERRQDDVLSQLEDLDQKLTSILKGLGVTMVDDESEKPSIRLADLGGDEDDEPLLSTQEGSHVADAYDAIDRDIENLKKRRRAA